MLRNKGLTGPITVLIIGAGAVGKSMAALLSDHATVMVYELDPATSSALKKPFRRVHK